MSSQQITIANRFVFTPADMIGQGGMGVVYCAMDTRTRQTVAVKQLKNDILSSNPDMMERFRREVETLRRLDHPNVVKLLGTARQEENYYIIMEYVPGGSLRDLLAKYRRIGIPEALQIALDLSDALTRAHRLNIIHRDLKPDNVLLGADGIPRLTDFGVARIGDRTRLTQSGSMVGTGMYLSPESCKGEELDSRDDIWSFGILLFEMITGTVPFQGTSLAAIVTSILMEPLPDIARLAPDAPPALVNLIRRMLEKDRDKRIASARQVGALLEAILMHTDASVASSIQATSLDPNDNLLQALLALSDEWDEQAREAVRQGQQLRVGDAQKAAYQRGVARAFEVAAQTLRGLLRADDSTAEDGDQPQSFAPVSKAQVKRLLDMSGMRVTQLYAHNDNTFSAVFPRAVTISTDDRLNKLRALSAEIIILEWGVLPESSDPYVEFAFSAPPRDTGRSAGVESLNL